MSINVLVIDDEILARKRILSLLKKVPEIHIIGECNSGEEAVKKINNLAPDLIFLDINMKDLNGFEVLKFISPYKMPIVIFVTAYDEYAIKAFDVFAFDYLLKPYENSRFFQSVYKVIDYLKKGDKTFQNVQISKFLKEVDSFEKSSNNLFFNKFPVRVGNKINFIDQNDINYVLASGSYSELHTGKKKIIVRDSLINLIKNLEQNKFLRIHRSVIININFILEILHSGYSELDVKMKDGSLFRVSKSYRNSFKTRLGLKQ